MDADGRSRRMKRFFNKIIFCVLTIGWLSKNSESIPTTCRDFLSDFEQFQHWKLEKIHELPKVKTIDRSRASPEQIKIGKSGSLFVEASKRCLKSIISLYDTENSETANEAPLHEECPFLTPIPCNVSAVYRTFDGSCNNLENPYWGKSNTPYRRLQEAEYADGIAQPRCESVLGDPLPGPRYISINFHRETRSEDLSEELTHLSMSFGQFLTHDLSITALHSGVDCCSISGRFSCPNPTCDDCIEKLFFEMCAPIAVPRNDPYFAQFGRTCLPFRRALPTPSLDCRLGPKEQLNAQTSYIDASHVYGSSLSEANSLREMTGGRLKITPTNDLELLLHDNQTFCKTPPNYCFVAGDVRLNQNYMLLSLHTLFLREHNRIAGLLAEADPSLDDETLFQIARRILIAELQHVTYNEYLPVTIGRSNTKQFHLEPLTEGYTLYEPNRDASVSNGHAGGAFRFSHSTIRRSFSNGMGNRILLSSSFGLTDPFYRPGDATSGFTVGMVNDCAQESDRLLTDQVIDKLFEERPGDGHDLAALDIMRGRDIGLKPYTEWRRWSGLSVPNDFDDLPDHRHEDRSRLSRIYQSVQDIDLWTGGLSETHIDGASVGPTFARIMAEQFHASKYGDRFWYEHDGPTRFSPNQLANIRKTTLSRIFCDNTYINRIQGEPFLIPRNSEENIVDCDSLAALDVCLFLKRWGDWSVWSTCRDGTRSRSRKCVGPVQGRCACAPDEVEIETGNCT